MGTGQRILLVEDNGLIALGLREVLARAGYEVVGPGTTLDEGLALAGERLDGAVLDVNLGGPYVWPVAEALSGRNVPFVLLTGFGDALDVPPMAVDVPRLSKPVDPNALLAALRSLLERDRVGNPLAE